MPPVVMSTMLNKSAAAGTWRSTRKPTAMAVIASSAKVARGRLYSGVQMAGLTMPMASTPPPLIVQR